MKFLRNDSALKQCRQALRHNQTDTEKAIWKHLRNRQFYRIRFFRQYSIGPYILDIYCPSAKLAIELDGGQHLQNESREYDAARTEYLKAHGIDVMRFWNNEVLLNIEGVLTRLAEKITPLSPPLL